MPQLHYLCICTTVRLSSAGSLRSLLDDGLNWRIHGQMAIVGASHLRYYYQCIHHNSHGCMAMKEVQCRDEDPSLFNVVYYSAHTCIQSTEGTTAAGKVYAATEPPEQSFSMTIPTPNYGTRRRRDGVENCLELKAIMTEDELNAHDDGYSWRKYGVKKTVGAMYTRAYFRCQNYRTQGCKAMKRVQRCGDDPSLFMVMYQGAHTCVDQSPSAVTQLPKQNSSAHSLLHNARTAELTVNTEGSVVAADPLLPPSLQDQ